MSNYLLRRIFWIIPTLALIILGAFFLSVYAPGDVLQMHLARYTSSSQMTAEERSSFQKELAHDLHLDLPNFYFHFRPAACSDTIHRIISKQERKHWNQMAFQTANWPQINKIRKEILRLKNGKETRTEVLAQLQFRADLEKSIELLSNTAPDDPLMSLRMMYHELETSNNSSPLLPVLQWNGSDNRFHYWFVDLLSGDMGVSTRSGQSVRELITPKLKISFLLSFLSVLLAYLVSIPLGLYIAQKAQGSLDKLVRVGSFLVYGFPSFFVATLLLFLFSNPKVFYWFPESGLMDPLYYDPKWNIFQKIGHQAPYFVLPIISFTYGLIAYLLQLIRSESLQEARKAYVLTAYTKGLTRKKVFRSHILPNILIPLITVFSQVFPAALGGSVIIESIFQIPGLGNEIYEAILTRDHPVVVGIFAISGFLTILFYLLADLLYVWADPRIRLEQR
jgi:peptide/nickel transport system permease protein